MCSRDLHAFGLVALSGQEKRYPLPADGKHHFREVMLFQMVGAHV